MNPKIKQFVKKNEPQLLGLVELACIAAASIITYSYVCSKFGYIMNKPHKYLKDEGFVTKSIAGNLFIAKIVPE